MRRADNKTVSQSAFYSDIILRSTKSAEGGAARDMLYAVTVRSPVERGTLVEILPPALPEGYTLITAADITGSKTVEINGVTIPVLCNGKISYKGEPLAILAGDDENTLRELLNGFNVVIDASASEGEDATSAEIEVKHGPFFASQCAAADMGSDGLPGEGALTSPAAQSAADDEPEEREGGGTSSGEAALDGMFEGCTEVYEHEWVYALKPEYYGETNGAVCYRDIEEGEEILTVITPTQWPSNLRRALSRVLGIDGARIRIHKTTPQCRTTTAIWYNSLIACQTAVAAAITGRAVRLVYSRDEQDEVLNNYKSIHIRYKTGCTSSGEIIALEAHITCDTGFANPAAEEIAERLTIAAAGAYNIKNIYVKTVARPSHTAPAAFESGTLDSAVFFALENQIESMCRLVGLTPIEMRKRNYLEFTPVSHSRPATPFVFEIEKFNNVLDALVKSSDFERKYAAYSLAASLTWGGSSGAHPKRYVSAYSAPLRGIGCAVAFEGSSYYGTKAYAAQKMEVTLNASDLVINAPIVSLHTQDIWTKIAEDVLELPSLKVKIENKEESPYPDTSFESMGIMASLLKQCCISLKNKKASDGPVTVRKRFRSDHSWDGDAFRGRPFYSTSFAAAAVEVEINPFTYKGNIRAIDIVISGGKIIDPTYAASAVRLAVQRTLSSLLEDDYLECPNIRISFVQSERDPSGIGELMYRVLPASYTQAVSQALGCTVDHLPLEPDSLYRALHSMKEPDTSRAGTDQEKAANAEQDFLQRQRPAPSDQPVEEK